jgi:signal transduction histidine kinase
VVQLSPPSFAIFDDYRPTVTIAVVIRWLLLGTWFFLNNYRADTDTIHLVLNLMGAGLALLNGFMSWRLVKGLPVTWRHALVSSIADLMLITIGLFLRGGLANDFYVFYYPALLGFSLMFPKRASFPLASFVMGLYALMAFVVAPGLDLEAEEEKQLAVRLACMVGIVGAGALITGWERSRRREAVAAERRISEENLELQRQTQRAELAAIQERSRLAEERGRIAREIHDGVAQSLYMLNISLETCVELAAKGREGLRERLQSLVGMSRQALLETRHYIFDLKPMLEGDRSIIQALENQLQEFRSVTSMQAEFSTIGGETPLPLATSAALFRIVQEGLANVYRHAVASRVDVTLAFEDDLVHIEIRDNGNGFPRGDVIEGRGLNNMTQRAEELGGSLSIESIIGQGTSLNMTIPLLSKGREVP